MMMPDSDGSYRLRCANGQDCVDVRLFGHPTPTPISADTEAHLRKHAAWCGWRERPDGSWLCNQCVIAAIYAACQRRQERRLATDAERAEARRPGVRGAR